MVKHFMWIVGLKIDSQFSRCKNLRLPRKQQNALITILKESSVPILSLQTSRCVLTSEWEPIVFNMMCTVLFWISLCFCCFMQPFKGGHDVLLGILKQHYVTFFLLQNHCDGTVSCDWLNGVSVSATPPLSLVSTLCNFSGRGGSQCYICLLQQTSFQGITLLRCSEFCLQLAPTYLTNCYRAWICIYDSGVALRNCGGRQILQNVNFY